MNELLKNIKAVGFDLDNTLYSNNPKIDNIIRNNISRIIIKKRPELKNIKNVRNIYEEEYEKTGSWTSIIRNLGINNPEEAMYNCMADPNIINYIHKNNKLVEIMNKIYKKYYLFIITSSPRDLGISKLEKIGITTKIFKYSIFGDDPGFILKVDGVVFKNFLNKSPYLANEHVYIGDSLKADILPTKNLGMRTIAIGKNILEADFSVKRVEDIEELLI